MRKLWSLVWGFFCLAVSLTAAETAFPISPDAQGQWKLTKYGQWKNDGGVPVLEVGIPADAALSNHTYGAQVPLDLTPYKGKTLVISFEVKAENVPTVPQAPHLAPKAMLRYRLNGVEKFANGSSSCGSYNWRPGQLTIMVTGAETKALLHIGIQKNTGKVWFRNLRLEAKDIDLFASPAPVAEGFRCEYSEAVRNTPRLRGSALMTTNTPADVASLAGNGANLVRLWIRYDGFDTAQFNKSLDDMDVLLKEAAKYGMKVIPVLSQVPGNRYEKPSLLGTHDEDDPSKNKLNFRLFFDKTQLDVYVQIWERIARRYKDNPTVYAYDLMNEPTQFGIVKYNYLDCQYRAAKAIRAIDAERPVIVSANSWDNPEAFSYFKPLPLKNVIYEVHMYVPHNYTHQGVGRESKERVKAGKFESYPDNIAGQTWNREKLAQALKLPREWQRKYGAILYCGEFSVIRWAPGAARWLEDTCSLLEEYGWHWAYHSYREWDGWSLEHGQVFANRKPVTEVTDRMAVMKKYWALNKGQSAK